MKEAPLLFVNIIVFSVTGAIALLFVPYWALSVGFDSTEIITTLALFFFTGMSITAGYHRLWAHKTYQAHPAIRFLLAVGGAMALQNSILHWASDHRVHHQHVDDTEKDPYSAKKGLWFSHIGWMLREYRSNKFAEYENCKDLKKDAIVMWQHNYYLLVVLIANFGITGLLGWLNGDVWSMILLAGVFRLVAVHHVTFFINSLAHYWGTQPYTDQNTARDNPIIALFTFGEGYHNYHHIFEYDYRNGIRWWHYDPTKWMIYGLSKLGLTTQLRRCPEERIAKAKVTMQLKHAENHIKLLPQADELMEKLQAEYEHLCGKMSEYYASKRKLLQIKKSDLASKLDYRDLKNQLKELNTSLKAQHERWCELLRHQTAHAVA